MREVVLAAGQKIKVLHLMTRAFRVRVEFDVKTADGSAPRGEVELSHGSTIVGRKTATLPLEAHHIFEKPWNQHGYQIHITSETDATVRFHTRHIREVHIHWAMAIMTIAFALIVLIGWLSR